MAIIKVFLIDSNTQQVAKIVEVTCDARKKKKIAEDVAKRHGYAEHYVE